MFNYREILLMKWFANPLVFILLLNVLSVFIYSSASTGSIQLDGVNMPNLATAMKKAQNGSTIKLGAGSFEQAGILTADDVKIVGVESETSIHSQTVQKKAALLIKGKNTVIENIECFNIQVRDGNGACIRFEGVNLELNNVYFHDSEQGLLTGPEPGKIMIMNSKFERLGKNGQAHGIYVGGGELYIYKSEFVSSKSEGMEIKSRAKKTVIDRSIVASLSGVDSRLLDIPNGGQLIVRDSVLQQGNESSNWDLIGFGLEGYFDAPHSIELVGNIILMEKGVTNWLLHIKDNKVRAKVENNVIVGISMGGIFDNNFYFSDRQDAGLPVAPFLPKAE
jgi:tetrahydromethanopterin S-methyltransferase subunit F